MRLAALSVDLDEIPNYFQIHGLEAPLKAETAVYDVAVSRLSDFARAEKIPVQYGVTGGGNDGSAFLRYGSTDVALGWPLRYSHSPGEVISLHDLDALARIVAALSRSW